MLTQLILTDTAAGPSALLATADARASATSGRAAITRRLDFLTLFIVVNFVFAAGFYYFRVQYGGTFDYPRATPFYKPWFRFHDFMEVSEAARTFDPYGRGVTYFPFAFVTMAPFFAWKGFVAFLLYYVCLLGFMVAWLRRGLPGIRPLHCLALTLLSYPVLFLLDRGNIEGMVFAYLALFAHLYRRRPGWSALCLAAATAMKGFPGIFVFLLIADRRGRETVIWALALPALSLASLLVFTPSVAQSLASLAANFHAMNSNFIGLPDILPHSTNLYCLARVALGFFRDPGYFGADVAASLRVARAYYPFAVTAGGCLVYWGAFREREPWRRFFILTAACLLLPTMSYEYRVLLLYVPLALFLRDPGTRSRKWEAAYLTLFGCLLVPRNYWPVRGEISSGSVLTPCLLVGFLLALALERRRKGCQSAGIG